MLKLILVTGAFEAIDFRGIDDIRLIDKWSEGPKTYLGLTVQDFPNMFMSIGPHQAYGNIPRSIEYAIGWIADCIEYCVNLDIEYIEATSEGVSNISYYPAKHSGLLHAKYYYIHGY